MAARRGGLGGFFAERATVGGSRKKDRCLWGFDRCTSVNRALRPLDPSRGRRRPCNRYVADTRGHGYCQGSEEGTAIWFSSPLSSCVRKETEGTVGFVGVKTYTTHEAALLTGTTVRALRKRIERGQLRAVQHGRYWRIPHSELERAGLIPSSGTTGAQGTEGTSNDVTPLLAALDRERAEGRRLAQELVRLRPLTAQIERVTADLHRERAERQAAEAREAEATKEAAELHAREQELAQAGLLARRRLIRELRRGDSRDPRVSGLNSRIIDQLETGYLTYLQPQARRLIARAGDRIASSDKSFVLRHPARRGGTWALGKAAAGRSPTQNRRPPMSPWSRRDESDI